MRPLDPFRLPLTGQILIEASAGTGKTYTLALLVLRLLLEQELSIDQILVVTFTNAATEELRGRIRKRLREALDYLREGAAGDTDLDRLIATCGGSGADAANRLITLLQESIARMDEAAIHTIHSFCQRMLQEHAFASGSPFVMDFIEDESRLRGQIMADFWRLHFYDNPRKAAWAAANWQTPDNLLTALGPHLERDDLLCLPRIRSRETRALEEKTEALFAQARQLWQRERTTLLSLLLEHDGLLRSRSTGYHPDRLEKGFAELDTWLEAEKPPWLMPKLACLFTASCVGAQLKKKCRRPPAHPFLDLFAQLHECHANLSLARKTLLLAEARAWLGSELKRRKEKNSQLFFNDLLSRLATALTDSHALARTLGKRFPAILVDEFQDTDPLQYRIFSTIHAARNNGGLFLIGDPKQAIYGFRGADIFTYLQARNDTLPEQRYTMTTNYRSARGMVATVNRLFQRDNPFLLAGGDIPFVPMQAHTGADRMQLTRQGAGQPNLSCLLLAQAADLKPLSKEKAMGQAAEYCAREIAALLNEGGTGQACIDESPVRGSDIGVLVRTHREAAAMRHALARLDIASVYAAQESVFASSEARQIHILLSCLLRPTDPALIRTLLATDLFGYTANKIDELREHETAWAGLAAEMDQYARLWREQGIMAMYYQLLARRHVVTRLLARPDGERILTNLNHLVELLQDASRTHRQEDMLLRWLTDRMQQPDHKNETAQLRLESDELLVRIVTIHRAKGLEYPLVFLPFLWSARPESGKPPFSFHHPGLNNRLCIDLAGNDPEHARLAEQERLAADLRLLYVAMTRAKYCCLFVWGVISGMEQSGLFYLLHEQMPALNEEIIADLDRLAQDDRFAIVCQEPSPGAEPVRAAAAGSARLRQREFSGTIDDSWQRTSYSNLIGGHDGRPQQPDHDLFPAPAQTGPASLDRFGFPRGTAAGTCLHAIFEQISFTDYTGRREIIAARLAEAGIARSWVDVVQAWLDDILATEIQPGLCLAGIEDRDRINELAFAYPLSSLPGDTFNQILADHGIAPLPGGDRLLNGLLVGFVDLVFRHGNRWYLADYKSNHLGGQPADYGPDRLKEAMLIHRYDLQYLFYTLALHRYLAKRLPGYDYATHIGPACYLFLRGMDPQIPGSGVFADRPAPELIMALDSCLKGKEA